MSNFQLKQIQQDKALYIDLNGVFDGASAWDLIGAIEEKYLENEKIYVDTRLLTKIFPFGKMILDANLPYRLKREKLLFGGPNANELMPEGCRLFRGHGSKEHQCRGNCKNCLCRNIRMENKCRD